MKKLLPIFLISFILFLFLNNIKDKTISKDSIKNCDQLDYENHNHNISKNFSELEMDLKITEERKWKKIILKTHISAHENKSHNYDAQYTKATIQVKNKHGFNCILKAEINCLTQKPNPKVNTSSPANALISVDVVVAF